MRIICPEILISIRSTTGRLTIPNEEEQVALYTRAIQKTGGLCVTI